MPEAAGRTVVPRSVVLGVDTATVVCVGVAIDGQAVASAQVGDRMAHVEQLTPLIRRVCAEAGVAPTELTDVVVGLGPGPYTGLRVGIVTARVLAEIAGARLHGICSLDVIAAQYAATRPGAEFVVATDARRKEVYWARYAADGTRLEGPSVNAADQVPRLPTIGPGTVLYPDRLDVVDGPAALDPAVLAAVGPRLADAGVEPLYLRRPDATEPGRRKSVLIRRVGR
jgi:tRNA threonylcarbamoyl adenosine modification protein YeaZ